MNIHGHEYGRCDNAKVRTRRRSGAGRPPVNPGAAPLPIVVAHWLSPRTRRILADTSCSFIDGTGVGQVRIGAETISLPRPDDAQLAAGPGQTASQISAVVDDICAVVTLLKGRSFAWFTGDSRDLPGRRMSPSAAVLGDPIDLLDWIAAEPAAYLLHSGIQAYLYSSDPDGLLKRPLSHPDPNPPRDAPVDPVIVTITSAFVVERLHHGPENEGPESARSAETRWPGVGLLLSDHRELLIDVLGAGIRP